MSRAMKDSGIPWIGEIPEGWEVARLKNVCTSNRESLSEKTDKDFEFEYVDIGSVTFEKGIFNSERITFGNAPTRARKRAQLGDIIISTVRTYLRAIDSINSIEKASYIYSTGFAVLTPFKLINSKYLSYIAKSEYFTEQVTAFSKGINYPSINSTDLLTLGVAFPPLAEQEAIAAFLDRKCGEVDEMVSLQEQVIEELKAYKQSVITEAVTKGLNPSAPMKPSNIDWIGQIPTHWECSQAKHFVLIGHGSDPKTEGEVPVYGSGATSFRTCGEFKNGPTVLIGRKGATLHIPHFIEGKYWNVDTAFDVKSKGKIVLKFYYYLAVVFDYKYYISQTTLPGMAQSSYNNMIIPIPPLSEQREIADYLDRKCADIDALIALKQQKIEDLKQYKKSLIYEYVTGKKQTPNYVFH